MITLGDSVRYEFKTAVLAIKSSVQKMRHSNLEHKEQEIHRTRHNNPICVSLSEIYKKARSAAVFRDKEELELYISDESVDSFILQQSVFIFAGANGLRRQGRQTYTRFTRLWSWRKVHTAHYLTRRNSIEMAHLFCLTDARSKNLVQNRRMKLKKRFKLLGTERTRRQSASCQTGGAPEKSSASVEVTIPDNNDSTASAATKAIRSFLLYFSFTLFYFYPSSSPSFSSSECQYIFNPFVLWRRF
ncbi:hypothetical protein NPIL_213721 [Nephila pilipes]|uniref:Uncharacterized protein n=1 Tax=Nephila pilipes TaxID=299642 RepID=A0A8X6P6S6_NEPPI|nr:hypothetical protein NPIL_213721 [Nephila pilipes]